MTLIKEQILSNRDLFVNFIETSKGVLIPNCQKHLEHFSSIIRIDIEF